MKHTLLTLATLFWGSMLVFAQPGLQQRKVQVAILFDTSNSMDGLIDQAKARIWNIVNEVSQLSYQGTVPDIEIGLYQYGNDNLNSANNYIERVLELTGDMDLISQKLFGLTTNGGSEYCGAVIGKSLVDLGWSRNPADLKMIYIAGNESFAQGPVDYKEQCKEAAKMGVYINTIYCGNYDQGVREFWLDGATCSQGDYFNIDSDKAIAHIDTPFDEEINKMNDSLNATYYGYGSIGRDKKSMQVAEDANAELEAVAVKTERSIVKSKKGVYKNSSWDLIDGVDEGEIELKEIEEKDLPDEFKGKTLEEKEELLKVKKEDRERYQNEIAELAKKRQAFIDEEMKKRAETGDVDDFGTSVNESIMKKAKENGYNKNAQNEE